MALAAQAALTWVPSATSGAPWPRPAAAPGPVTRDGGSPGAGSAGGTFAGTGCAVPLFGAACLLSTGRSRRGTGTSATQRRSAALSTAAEAAKPVEAEGAGAVAAVAPAFDVTREAGVCDPCGKPGEYVWDPLKLSKNATEETFRWYRQAELKHGRVSMLAIAGLLNQHYWRFEGLELDSFEGGLGLSQNRFGSVPNGVAAIMGDAGPYIGILVLLAGIVELRSSDDGREPGNFGDPACIVGTSVDGFVCRYDAEWRNFELNHGRLAMFGVVGAVTAEYVTGLDTFGQWAQVLTAK